MWTRIVNDYFSYTYKERIGIFILLGLIILCLFIPLLYPSLTPKHPYDHSKFSAEIARLQLSEPDSFADRKFSKRSRGDNFTAYTTPGKNDYQNSTAEVFYFDPNNTSFADWKRLGITDKTIKTIQKYLSKGGHFYKPEDISKIWGLHPGEIKRLLPYVNIAKKVADVKNEQAHFFENRKVAPAEHKPVDINTADTTAFIALPGIGSKLAQRIIKFRDKLGGFYSIEQVGETFGLPDSTFTMIKSRLILSNSAVKKININASLLDELKTHPYIRYAIANAIIQYRNQHGSFSSTADLKKVMLVTDDIYNKLVPYLVTQ